MAAYTSAAEFKSTYETLDATYATHKTKDVRWRKWQLKQLWWLLVDNTDAFSKAFAADLGRTEAETRQYDIASVKKDIKEYIDNVDVLAKGNAPEGAGILMGRFGKAWLRKEPLGVCLIIGAWNFPLVTLLGPATAAIAAGNCVVLKPSELAGSVSNLLAEFVPKYMDPSAIRVVTGGAQETGLMLEQKWNHIFYTGGSKVGRIIAAAAAKHLTPTVLELGGQAPAIVTKSANIDLAAKRIVNFKLTNSGQICLNVNHVFADPAVHDELVERMQHWLQEFVGKDNTWLANIISDNHYKRVTDLLSKTSGKITYNGESQPEKKFVHPAIITDVKTDDSLMSEELFAPFIPVIKGTVEQAVATVSSMPHPLGLYIFATAQSEIDYVLDRTTSGGVTINDVALHAAVPNAPFGGVGESGNGAYHGKVGFDAFSHTRPVVGLPNWMDVAWRYGAPKLENLPKWDTAKATWKKGETLEEQTTSGKSWLGIW
ncbi:putative aldehyde dehydrogenase NAD(P)-dependent, aldehyde dehydrogenase, cysteine active [Septoria linicola]|nr:putative aldehyde dehydrogenase NAD(P)-dependent, aldehyde dehydrogenase, cysteine active [Septoria linicola]